MELSSAPLSDRLPRWVRARPTRRQRPQQASFPTFSRQIINFRPQIPGQPLPLRRLQEFLRRPQQEAPSSRCAPSLSPELPHQAARPPTGGDRRARERQPGPARALRLSTAGGGCRSPRCPDLPPPAPGAGARRRRTRASRAAPGLAMLAAPARLLSELVAPQALGEAGWGRTGRLPPGLCSGRASGLCHPAGRRLAPGPPTPAPRVPAPS